MAATEPEISAVSPEQLAKGASATFRVQTTAAIVAGLLSLVGWGWAIALAFVPVHAVEGVETDCGAPVLFDESAFARSLHAGDDESFQELWTRRCAESVDPRLRHALGIAVVTAPLSALWLWCACTLHVRRAEARTTAEVVREAASAGPPDPAGEEPAQ